MYITSRGFLFAKIPTSLAAYLRGAWTGASQPDPEALSKGSRKYHVRANRPMTLTVVVGSSGSGKTTFLEHVHKLHSCTYIRQYHTLRPYVPVKKIPRFDPTQLPYWKLYSDKELKESGGKKNESYNPGVKIGGTMAGEFTAGLSGGQRKMMLFELVRQRVSGQSDLLIVLDEPFAGVTDDFVPYIMERLDEMRIKHNILLVTNDHVAALTKMADSTITVSAIDRSKVLL